MCYRRYLIKLIDDSLRLKIVSGMKNKIVGKIVSQLNVKVTKQASETLAGKRVKNARIIDVKMATKDKRRILIFYGCRFIWMCHTKRNNHF